MTIKFKKLHEDAILPTRGSKLSAGLDLYAVSACTIYKGAQVKIATGLAVDIPEGFYGRVASRSGLAVNYGVNVHAGVIDADYRGEIHVCLINHGDKQLEVKAGDRIAQLIIETCSNDVAEWCDDLDGTDRGNGGFGSTGR